MTEEKPPDPETWFTRRGRGRASKPEQVGIPGYSRGQEDAVKAVLEAIPQSASVGIGGSVTVRELGSMRR